MTRHDVVVGGALGWAVVGAAVAWASVPSVNADARILVGVASFVGPSAALCAAAAVRSGTVRLGGGFLLVSVLTPTYFAYLLNLPALLAGLALVVAPRVVLEGRSRRARPTD